MSYLKKIEYGGFEEQVVIAVNNPYQLKIRPEKQIAEILGLSRSQVKDLLDKGKWNGGRNCRILFLLVSTPVSFIWANRRQGIKLHGRFCLWK